MILSDKSIVNMVKDGKLVIRPFNEKFVGPCSYDVTLGNMFMQYCDEVLDFDDDDYSSCSYSFSKGDRIVIVPSGYDCVDEEDFYKRYNVKKVFYGGVLGLTDEYVELPNDVAAQYQGRSSLGRMFLTSHQTAGWIDAGFKGRIVLEIVALDRPVILRVGQRIGQLIFFKLDDDCEYGYCECSKSKYKNQKCIVGYKCDKF